MEYSEQIRQFVPSNAQEEADQRVMLAYLQEYSHNVLLRDNLIAHITSSGFVMNRARDKVLLVHHNIRDAWAWTGGHADGDGDLLAVARREAQEETGVDAVVPLAEAIASLDILAEAGHWRRGIYVNAHLHLSVGYILICDEGAALRPAPGENTDVAWFPVAYFTEEHFGAVDAYLYKKLIARAQRMD